MKKTLKVTFGTMLAVSTVVPTMATAYERFANHLAVWVEGTYTEPSNNGLSVGDQLFAAAPGAFAGNGNTLDGGRRHVFLKPDHQFDYALGFTYRWPYSHSRIFFTYDHYNSHVDTQGDVNIRNIGFEPGVGLAGGAGQTQGIASYKAKSHEFRIGAIHDLHFGDHFCLDLLAFFEYDKLKQNLHEFNSKNGLNFNRETEERVRGFGPGVGFMTRWYARNPHWHIFAGASTTLLKAENDYQQSFFATPTAFYIYDPEESDSLVGKLDINFGINYRCAFKREMHGMAWDVALGMRYMNMFNAFKNGNTAFNPAAELTPSPGFEHIGPEGFAANLGAAQDWGRWGPFLKFKIGGAHS